MRELEIVEKDTPYDGMTVFAGLETVRSFLGMRDHDTRKRKFKK